MTSNHTFGQGKTMLIDELIYEKRRQLQLNEAQEKLLRQELHMAFQEKAKAICPIKIGTQIEYEPQKFGRVDLIEYDIEYLDEIDHITEIYWAVSGKKINKTGEFGLLNFSKVGPKTHLINGTSFTPKDIADYLG